MLKPTSQSLPALNVTQASTLIEKLWQNLNQAVVIQPQVLQLIFVALFGRGHLLLEDVPGVGKTLVAKALAQSVDSTFNRVQCTPDLLPSDITGISIYHQHEHRFVFLPGPLFAQFVLVDEINRATPRTQSSLLECMAERQVTVDGQTHILAQPFFLMATQNPVETAGTFPLPEAQLDRFLISLSLGYPQFEDEVAILEREQHQDPLDRLEAVLAPQDITALQQTARAIGVARPIKEYIVRLLQATRSHPEIILGGSPRAGVALQQAAQVMALLNQRDFVIPDDVRNVAQAVLAHRLMTHDPDSELRRALIDNLIKALPVPVG